MTICHFNIGFILKFKGVILKSIVNKPPTSAKFFPQQRFSYVCWKKCVEEHNEA